MSTELTCEQPLAGLKIYQPARGFRYAMDPFLLSAWVLEGPTFGSVVDIGTGSGVIALLLKQAGIASVTGIDVRPEWITLARRSADESGLDVTFEVGDVRHRTRPEPADLVVSNPPYRPLGCGPLPSNPWRAWGRHELAGSLAELIPAMARLGRRIALVLPAHRSTEASDLLHGVDRPVVRRCGLGEKLVLIEGSNDGRSLRERRVALRGPHGGHSQQVRHWYRSLGIILPGPKAARPADNDGRENSG